MGGILPKIGYCAHCKKIVSYRRSRDIFNRLVPSWVNVEGSGLFHKSCWGIFRKSIVTAKEIEYQTPPTPFGKGSIKKKIY